jgi:site-specific DNA-methyltransferase (adenine-specific)
MEINQIYNEDCIELMKQIENDSIDLIIADPPYNVSRENNFQTIVGAKRI